MDHNKFLLLIFSFFLILTSCSITDNIRTMQIEVMRPGIINIPENIDTLAILYRDVYDIENEPFKYFDGLEVIKDSTIKISDISKVCIDSLERKLKETSYFKKVYNYHDSFKNLWTSALDLNQPNRLFQMTNSDLCIILEYINFYRNLISDRTDYSTISAQLTWVMVFRGDTTGYYYYQTDTLDYDYNTVNALIKGSSTKPLVKNAAAYLGQSFASKLLPNWIPVDRMYYKSSNPDMMKAEKFAMKNDWLNAAEIWNRMTFSKNEKMSAKACFNMALACEMEGKLDLSIDWLIHSFERLTRNNVEHRDNCKKYINVLAMRKKEIERLSKQVRNTGLK